MNITTMTASTIYRTCLHNIERDDWHQFIDLRYTSEAETLKPMIDLCLLKAHGVKTIANILELMDKGGEQV